MGFWRRIKRRIGKIGKGLKSTIKKVAKNLRKVNKFLSSIPGLNEIIAVASVSFPTISKFKNVYERAKAVTKLIASGEFNSKMLGELARFVPQVNTAVSLVQKGKKGLRLLKKGKEIAVAVKSGNIVKLARKEFETKVKSEITKRVPTVLKKVRKVKNVVRSVVDLKAKGSSVNIGALVKKKLQKKLGSVSDSLKNDLRKAVLKSVKEIVPGDSRTVEVQKKKAVGKFFASVMSRRH